MTIAKGSGVRAVCGALMTVVSVALGISGAVAEDLVGSEQIGASDAGDATSIATGGGRRLWSRQPGTREADPAFGVATDTDGNVYVVGFTDGALGGPKKGQFSDAWVIKFDRAGRRLWSQQPGTGGLDDAFDVATDADGNVYVVGDTDGALGGPSKGDFDAWVTKFDADGRRLWSRQPGTSAIDLATGVATDTDGNVYVVGWTTGALGGANKGEIDGWVIKFDSDGRRLWSRQPGTGGLDHAFSVATDTDGNVYVVGDTQGALGGANKGGSDAWVSKYAR